MSKNRRKPSRIARQWFEKCNYNCRCWDGTPRTFAIPSIIELLRRAFPRRVP